MRKYVNINVHFLSIWVKNIFFEIFITKTPFTLYFFTDFDKNAQEGTRRHIFKWRIRICTNFEKKIKENQCPRRNFQLEEGEQEEEGEEEEE